MKLRYSPRARDDIAQIYQYIAERDRPAAIAVVDRIRSTSERLARYPGLGRKTDIAGVRVCPTARFPYLVYHRVLDDELIILHVRDGRRDMPREGEL